MKTNNTTKPFMETTLTYFLKKIILISAVLLCSTNLSAQISFSAGGGLNVAKVTGCKGNLRTGYKLGAYLDYKFHPYFSLYTGLELSNKGTYDFDNSTNSSINALYIEVPVLAGYRKTLSHNANLILRTGPYFAYGVGGNTKMELQVPVPNSDPVETRGEIFEHSTFSREILKDYDFGFVFSAGIEHNTIVVALNAQYGFLNISNVDQRSLHNQSLALTLTYRFYSK